MLLHVCSCAMRAIVSASPKAHSLSESGPHARAQDTQPDTSFLSIAAEEEVPQASWCQLINNPVCKMCFFVDCTNLFALRKMDLQSGFICRHISKVAL